MAVSWQQFWNDFAFSSYDHVRFFPENKRLLQRVSSLAGSGKKILDAGCGSGNLAMILAAQNEVFAVDFSVQMLALAQEKARTHPLIHPIRLSKEDVTDLSFADDFFDCAVSVNVLFNLKDPVKAILETHRVLRENGHFILSCPCEEAKVTKEIIEELLDYSKKNHLDQEQTASLLEKNRQLFDLGGMQFRPTREELERLLQINGFSVLGYERIYYGLNHLIWAKKDPSVLPRSI